MTEFIQGMFTGGGFLLFGIGIGYLVGSSSK
jgi:hypothetical protein